MKYNKNQRSTSVTEWHSSTFRTLSDFHTVQVRQQCKYSSLEKMQGEKFKCTCSPSLIHFGTVNFVQLSNKRGPKPTLFL